jgi:hypothetical protein
MGQVALINLGPIEKGVEASRHTGEPRGASERSLLVIHRFFAGEQTRHGERPVVVRNLRASPGTIAEKGRSAARRHL